MDEDRLTAIEDRLAALEARSHDASVPQAPPVGEPESDTFWALDGLRSRYPQGGGVLFTGSVTLPGGGDVQWQEGAVTADLLEVDWAERAEALAALGHPVRLQLLQQILHGVTTAQELTGAPGVGSSGQVYHHLRQLTAAGWLRAVGGGRHEIPAARIVPLLVVLRAVC